MDVTQETTTTSTGRLSIDHVLLLALIAGALLLYFLGLGSYALWDPWEPKYATSMLRMAERGDYLLPYLDGHIRWTKPILFYWTMLVPMKIWGNNEWTLRLPSAIAATGCLLLVFSFLRRLRGRRTAMIAACVLGTMPQFVFMARQGMPDMLMTCFLAGAMGFLALGRFGSERNSLCFRLFYLCAALAFLTKGPMTSVIILIAVGLFWLIDLDPRRLCSLSTARADFYTMLRRYHVASGVGIFTAVAAPWFLYVMIRHWDGFFAYFVSYENLQRFTEPIRGHHGLVAFYVRTMFHGMYPWSCMVPISIVFLFAGHGQLTEEARQRWYYLSWAVASFLLFSFAATKLPYYILPITPPLAVLVALFWEDLFARETPYWVRATFLLSLLFLALPIRDFLVEGDRNLLGSFTNRHTIGLPELATVLKFVFAGWGLAMLYATCGRRPRIAAVGAVLVALLQATYFTQIVLPQHTPKRNMRTYLHLYDRYRSDDSILAFFGKFRHSISYYHGKQDVYRFEKDERPALLRLIKDKPHVFLITKRRYRKSLLKVLNRVSRRHWRTASTSHPAYVLLSNEPATSRLFHRRSRKHHSRRPHPIF